MGNSKGNCDHTGRCFYFPCSVVERAAALVNASGVPAHALDFSGLMDQPEMIGGCSHPSESAHRRMAAIATARLRSVLKWTLSA